MLRGLITLAYANEPHSAITTVYIHTEPNYTGEFTAGVRNFATTAFYSGAWVAVGPCRLFVIGQWPSGQEIHINAYVPAP